MNARSGRFSHWLLLLTIALAAGPATSEVETPLTVSTATFEADGHARRQVALPHTWALDGLAAGGKGQYRIDFRLAEELRGPWALVGSRVASLHAVRLNGALVHGTMAEGERERRGVPPILIDLPPALLRRATTGSRSTSISISAPGCRRWSSARPRWCVRRISARKPGTSSCRRR